MRRPIVLALAAVAAAAGLCAEAAAEDIYGHVLSRRDPDTHVRLPISGQFLYLHRLEEGPDGGVQMAAYSGPDGAYFFGGLMPGFTYKIEVVTGNPEFDRLCPFRMMYIP